MNKKDLEKFLLTARSKTYAAAQGKSEGMLPGSVQYEHSQGDFMYRDIYYIGNSIFPGLETVYLKDKPVWSMSYFGDFSGMSEEQIDSMLRKALIDNQKKTRMYNQVNKAYGDFTYICDGSGSIDELSGTEEIYAKSKKIYFFCYAGGFIG